MRHRNIRGGFALLEPPPHLDVRGLQMSTVLRRLAARSNAFTQPGFE